MRRLLRSVIDFGGVTQENLIQNLSKLTAAKIEWVQPPDQKIYEYVLSYFQQRMEMPSGQTVLDYFTAVGDNGDIEVIERLKDIAAAPAYIRTNYHQLVTNFLEDQRKAVAVGALKEAHVIITRGMDTKENGEEVRKQGVKDGVLHFISQTTDLLEDASAAKSYGDIRLEGAKVWKEYEQARDNKDKVWGRFSGINEIDKMCHGIKRGELWIHAAYAGELKTSLALTWAYNLVTRYRANVLYCSFEMRYEHICRLLYVMHSANPKWRAQGFVPLDYRRVRDGELTPSEESFLKLVIEDFSNNAEYCHLDVWAPDHDVDLTEVQARARLTHQQMEVGLIVLDHGGLMEARRKKRSKDYVIELNSILRDAKKLALQFNSGEGIPVLMLFQINRQGKDDAAKNSGKYKLSALSYSNEAERSADVVTTTYIDEDHRANGTTLICNLKNRDNPLFAPFEARVMFGCRRIMSQDVPTVGSVACNLGVEGYDDV